MFEAEAWGKVMFIQLLRTKVVIALCEKSKLAMKAIDLINDLSFYSMARTMTSCTTFNCLCTTLSSFHLMVFYLFILIWSSPLLVTCMIADCSNLDTRFNFIGCSAACQSWKVVNNALDIKLIFCWMLWGYCFYWLLNFWFKYWHLIG